MDDRPPGTPGARWYCPVLTCSRHDPVTSAGWATLQAMRPHLEEHMSGRLAGSLPAQWLTHNSLSQCQVCHRLLALRFGPSCPRCRPALLREEASHKLPAVARPVPPEWPTLREICSTQVPCRKYVPKGAQAMWSRCLTGVLHQVAEFNDVRAWTELLLLTKCVLLAPPRTGREHKRHNELDAKDRCHRWLEGQRESLWAGTKPKRKRKQQPKEAPSMAERMERAQSLLEEGLLMRKACAALVDGQMESFTDEVFEAMQKKHPAARPSEASRLNSLRPVSSAAAPDFYKADVLKA
eukprot:1132488-Amphidinium_carterae.1